MSKPNFGVHQVSLKGIVNGETVIANATYVDSAEPSLESENIKLETGSYRFPVHSVRGRTSGTLALNLRSFDSNLFKLLAPQTATSHSYAENIATGAIEVISGLDATAGVASIAVDTGADADLRYGTYWAKFVTATTFDLYLSNNLTLDFTDESGKVASGVVLPSAGTVVFQGIEFTGGTAVAATVGDIVAFNVIPPHAKYMKQHFGGAGEDTPEIEVRVFGEKIDNEIQCTTFYRCKSNGNVVPKNTAMEYATMEVTLDIMQDTVSGKALTTEWIKLA